ncbi:hypothetical protein Ciccas_002574 [Cichlidogyrus casuarinus]|uniref:Uncharacterized protein n=1 Tax=Cichlidogyrus casuarinus TaxID=1844966 RepID=A0ABD2QGU6_9PLAT
MVGCKVCECTKGQWVCSRDNCNKDCKWSDWMPVTDCDAECGQGTQLLQRHHAEESTEGGLACDGPATKNVTCFGPVKCCDEHVEFVESTSCELTCRQLRQESKRADSCEPNKCRCASGYVRDEESGQCILEADCLSCQGNNATMIANGDSIKDEGCFVSTCHRGLLVRRPLNLDEIGPCCVNNAHAYDSAPWIVEKKPQVNQAGQCCFKALMPTCGVVVQKLHSVQLDSGLMCYFNETVADMLAFRVCTGACAPKQSYLAPKQVASLNQVMVQVRNEEMAAPLSVSSFLVEPTCSSCCRPTAQTVVSWKDPLGVECTLDDGKVERVLPQIASAIGCQCS